MNRLYKKGSFEIYGYDKAYIVYNKRKSFDKGHTHVTNFNTAKYLIYLSNTKTVPKHLSLYLYESLIRINDDEKYISLIKQELYKASQKKKNKSQYK